MEIIIKMDHDEPVKVKTSSIYGEQHPLPDWDPEKLRDEIQDLKLENDRLQKREELYQRYLNSFDCHERSCVRCTQYRPGHYVPCMLALPQERHKVINTLKKELEDLG